MMDKKTNSYEGMFLFKMKDAKEGWDGLVEHVGKMVESVGGTVASAVKWDERKLTYNVNGQNRAAYMLVYFDAPPGEMDTIRHSCKMSERIMRALILRNDKGVKSSNKEEEHGEPQQSIADRKPDEGP